MEDSSSDFDPDDTDTESNTSEQSNITTSSNKSEQDTQTPCKNIAHDVKHYTELKPINTDSSETDSTSEPDTSPSHHITGDGHSSETDSTSEHDTSPSPVNLKSNSDLSFPPSSDPSNYSIYSSTQIRKSSPTFPSDNSTCSDPSPIFPKDTTVSDENSDDDSINDFHIDPKSETVNRKRALFHVAEIPFDTLAHMVKTYLESIEKDPCKPTWPVPDMDRNQKCNFRRKTDKFKLINGSLRHQHVYVDEKNKTKRGNYVIS